MMPWQGLIMAQVQTYSFCPPLAVPGTTSDHTRRLDLSHPNPIVSTNRCPLLAVPGTSSDHTRRLDLGHPNPIVSTNRCPLLVVPGTTSDHTRRLDLGHPHPIVSTNRAVMKWCLAMIALLTHRMGHDHQIKTCYLQIGSGYIDRRVSCSSLSLLLTGSRWQQI